MKLTINYNKHFFQRFGVFYNMWWPTYPSSGNTTVYRLCGRKLAKQSIIQRNKISFFIKCGIKHIYVTEINSEWEVLQLSGLTS